MPLSSPSPGSRGAIASLWLAALVLLALLASAGVPVARADTEGSELIGQQAPEWKVEGWIGSKPLALQDVSGRPTLVRWWTDTCPHCAASAPVLRELRGRYADRGLVVVAMYHPKPRGRHVTPDAVHEAAARLGIPLPVALDLDWSLLDRYWLAGGRRRATSVSFLLDGKGVIRHVHPGPLYLLEPRHEGDPAHADYLALRDAIERLLGDDQP